MKWSKEQSERSNWIALDHAMTENKPFKAVIADMDGVITQTARVHERAWKAMFDEVLKKHNQPPFTHEDYRQYVDGKPRHDGIRDFLTSRSLSIEEGDPSDPPDRDTVYGMAKRKNTMFLEMIERNGVTTYPDAIAAIERWQRGRLPIAVISASRNCRRILEAAGLRNTLNTIVDGQTAQELGLDGKPGLIQEAARRLNTNPIQAVVLEDATSGVRAAVQSGIGLVIGINRGDNAEDLRDAGAHEVVSTISALRFPRAMPAVNENRDAIQRLRGTRSLAIFLDYDGTLTPIVNNPDTANMSDDMRQVIERLAARYPVAIVSGRDRADVQQRVQLDNLYYAGNHGFDIQGPDKSMTNDGAEDALPEIDQAESQLRETLRSVTGSFVERKRFSVATHYRNVAEAERQTVRDTVADVAAGMSHLRRRDGKMVIELLPDVEWDKGFAINWIIDALAIDTEKTLVLYIGDDETDEDGFRALHGRGIGIRVGETVVASLADYVLPAPSDVKDFLDWLAQH